MANTNECGKCAHDLKNEDVAKAHEEIERDGVKLLHCKVCGEVCGVVQPPVTASAAPTPPSGAPPVSVAPPQSTEDLARAVAQKMATMRDEMIWKSLRQPGVIVQFVDGGFIIENRWGEVAVRTNLEGQDGVLEKVKEWLKPRV